MTDQAPGFYRRQAGSYVVTAINDGYLDIPLEAMQGITPEAASKTLVDSFRRPSPRSAVNVYVLQGQGRTILIDTGAGTGMGPTLGRLLPNLAAAGVDPAAIDLLLLTHLHPDHSGNMVTAEGTALFPNAELALAEAEAGFWLDEATAAAAPEGARPYFLAAQTAAAPYRARMRLLGTTEAAPGVTPVPLPGHTPGHTGYRIGDGDDALLIWGDVMHVPDVQSAYPEVGMVYDADPAQAIATRRRMLDMAASERIAVAGMHLHFPGFAHVARAGAAYAIVPGTWLPVL